MNATSDLLHLPYSPDLTEGGIAYALQLLPYAYRRAHQSTYDQIRRTIARVAVELAFRRYLNQQNVDFKVKNNLPFTEPVRYDVVLGRRRCEIHSFLISQRRQISALNRDPNLVRQAQALVASDQNAGYDHFDHDLYLFAFVSGLVTHSREDFKKASAAGQPYYLMHMMPDTWLRPVTWHPLGSLALKSEEDKPLTVEIGGQLEGRELTTIQVELPPKQRVEVDADFYSLAYLHVQQYPAARIGLHSPVRNETYVVDSGDWHNIWVYGLSIVLAGYLSREEFNRRADFVAIGTKVFQYEQTRMKSLAVPVSELKPISDLLERVRAWNP